MIYVSVSFIRYIKISFLIFQLNNFYITKVDPVGIEPTSTTLWVLCYNRLSYRSIYTSLRIVTNLECTRFSVRLVVPIQIPNLHKCNRWIVFIKVARSRVELLFREWKSLVLTDRRTGHLNIIYYIIKKFQKIESLVLSVISLGTSIPIVLCKVL